MDEHTSLIAFAAVADLDQAEKFYSDVLGLSLTDERPFALVAQLGGAMLRITAVGGSLVTAPYTVAGWRVADIDAQIDDLVERGLVFNRYDGLAQDERGVWAAPDGAKVAWFKDPDGNTLSLTQFPNGY